MFVICFLLVLALVLVILPSRDGGGAPERDALIGMFAISQEISENGENVIDKSMN